MSVLCPFFFVGQGISALDRRRAPAMKKYLLASLLLTLAPTCWAAPPQPAAAVQSRQNIEFENADLVHVVKSLAKRMGRNVYIGPGVEGTVTIHLTNVTPEEALAKILKQQSHAIAYKLIGYNTLVVAAPEKVDQIGGEILGKSMKPPKPGPQSLSSGRNFWTLSNPSHTNLGPQRAARPKYRLETEPPAANTEQYQSFEENPYFDPRNQPYSTFSIDVDTASYANVRRFLTQGQIPPQDSVRLEELVNYFVYDYPAPQGNDPVAISTELGACPWNPQHYLLRVGLQAQSLPAAQIPARNLVFLLDVSGSMDDPHKLPLLKQSLKLLVDQLRPEDRVAMVVYAGASGLALPSTPGTDKTAILAALDRLEAGGSTNGAEGIQLAYKVAREQFAKDGINRVILCTDGDFNVGTTGQGDLTRLIEKERKSGVFLSVLGYGMGNLKDSTLEKLADKGNGNYAYIDSLFEARKVLVEQAGGTLVPVAKDVKVQIEFNPARVGSYRLLGYEDRMLRDQDFQDDRIDAGEMGSGQSVTALYEIIPPGQESKVDPLKYQKPAEVTDSSELANVKVRFKRPNQDSSELLSHSVDSEVSAQCSQNFHFASAVAAFANRLRNSQEPVALSTISDWARSSRGTDSQGYRADFLQLVEMAAKAQTASR